VCCVVTRTDQFRAAIASAPLSDLVSFALQVTGGRLSGAGQVEGGHARLGGTLWEQRERYVENSPVFHLDKVATPVLLLCGTVDSLIAQAEEMYAGLLRLEKTATLVRYYGEGHSPYGSWTDENVEDYWTRILAWLGRYLGEAPPTAESRGNRAPPSRATPSDTRGSAREPRQSS
jgi:dipeptidyl aminopeptidase/acylaminoacyl peptidase